jgi:hypothetical protein
MDSMECGDERSTERQAPLPAMAAIPPGLVAAMSKEPRNTRRKLHAARVRAERELRAELKEQQRREKEQEGEWGAIVRTLRGVQPWKS